MLRSYRNPSTFIPYFKDCIICCECASGILNLSTYDYTYLNFFYKLPKIFGDSLKTFAYYIYNVNEVDYSNTEKIEINGTSLYITNEERTIMDMIKYECDDKMILQSIDEYIDRHGNTDKLYSLSKKYNNTEELEKYIADIGILWEC